MKTRTIVTDINHEDLVDLLSTALYGSSYLIGRYSQETYKTYCDVDENDCFEDKMAKLLLRGDEIQIGDFYVEDETDFFGTLPHKFDGETMWYDVTLDDIKRGVQACLDGLGNEREDIYLRRCATHLINGDGDMDLPEAESIMQIILFGKLIYG